MNRPIIIFSSVRETHWTSTNMVRYLYNKRNDTWNESYTVLRIWARVKYDPRSYGRIFNNCVKKPEIFRTSTGFESVTSRYRCDAQTNWTMKPLTLGAGHLWVLNFMYGMNQLTKWYMKSIIDWAAHKKSSKAMILAVIEAISAIA